MVKLAEKNWLNFSARNPCPVGLILGDVGNGVTMVTKQWRNHDNQDGHPMC